MTHPFSRFITSVSALLMAGLAWLWLHQPLPSPVHSAAVQHEYHFDVEKLNPRQAETSIAIEARQRPLFAPSRKPFVPVPPAPPIPTPPPISVVEIAPTTAQVIEVTPVIPPAPLPPHSPPANIAANAEPVAIPALIRIEDAGLKLQGIMVNRNARKALINSSAEPAGRWLNVGESIAEWQIVSIEDNRVTMKNGDTRGSLQLYVDKSGN